MPVLPQTDATLGCPAHAREARLNRPDRVAADPVPPRELQFVMSGVLGVMLFTAHRRFDALLDVIAACGEGQDLTWIE